MTLAMRRQSGPPEDSIAMRLVVAALVEVAIAAVVVQPGAVPGPVAVATLVLAPIGYWVSFRRRRSSNLLLKVALSIALLASLGQFLGDVRSVTSFDQARIPLASLFLWVQVLHAFDVPRRRDLSFSVVSSLILMAEAGSLSLSTAFAPFVLIWGALAGTWLSLSSRPSPSQVTPVVAMRRNVSERSAPWWASIRSAAASAGLALLTASLVFLAMPRLPGSFVRTPPFSLAGSPAGIDGFDGGVTNPGLPADAGSGVIDFSSGGYPGFGDVVDLRARGRLSDEVAFRVRAQQPALWRAEVFDRYDDSRWSITDDATEGLPQHEDGLSYAVPAAIAMRNDAIGLDSSKVVQTFYIEVAQPNVLFAASSARQVYFPSSGLRIDTAGSIRSPILLDEGLVYSVISEVPVTDDWWLRTSSGRLPRGFARYLQLPDEVPARVATLASRITADRTTLHGRVLAVQSWLQANTRYDLDAPRDPPEAEAVDHFLFETRRGYCEQIATSMAVMLRTLGIASRLVTGYGPGERNPLTGYLEVKQSDAHAWLEVFYPGIGWVQYDPTFGVPHAAPGAASRFMAGPVFAALGRFISTVVPEPLAAAVGAVMRSVGRAGVIAIGAWPVALAGLAIAAMLSLALRRRGRRADRRAVAPAEAAFLELAIVLEPFGHERAPTVTPSEYLDRLRRDGDLDHEVVVAAVTVVRTFEQERFARSKPTDADLTQAMEATQRVRELARRR